MNITLLPGHLLVVKDPPTTESAGGIAYPDVETIYPTSAYVHIHEKGGEIAEDLTHRRIIFAKFAERDFEWKGTTFSVVAEAAVLAVWSRRMNKEELKAEIGKFIDENVTEESGEVDLDEAGTDIANFIDELDGDDDAEAGAES